MYLANSMEPPKSVSSDFGKLDVMRHLISGEDCAIAGAATALAAAPAAETFKKSRRFIKASPWWARPDIRRSSYPDSKAALTWKPVEPNPGNPGKTLIKRKSDKTIRPVARSGRSRRALQLVADLGRDRPVNCRMRS